MTTWTKRSAIVAVSVMLLAPFHSGAYSRAPADVVRPGVGTFLDDVPQRLRGKRLAFLLYR